MYKFKKSTQLIEKVWMSIMIQNWIWNYMKLMSANIIYIFLELLMQGSNKAKVAVVLVGSLRLGRGTKSIVLVVNREGREQTLSWESSLPSLSTTRTIGSLSHSKYDEPRSTPQLVSFSLFFCQKFHVKHFERNFYSHIFFFLVFLNSDT